MTTCPGAHQRFADAVCTRLDTTMAEAGFSLNGVYDGSDDSGKRYTSVLYEGVLGDLLARYPGIDPVWDEEWRSQVDGCVDLWIE